MAARTITFLNTSRETVSVRYNCCTTLAVSDPVLNQRSVRPRCSVSDMSDTIVSFNALPNFSLISVRRSLNTSASALQIFLVSVIPDPHSLHFYCIALCCHGFTVRPRCQGTVGVVSRNLVCPKPYSVCMSARRPTFITPDRASSRMHS